MEGIYTIDQLPLEKIIASLHYVPFPVGRHRRKGDNIILDIVTAFDIETTTVYIKDQDGIDRPHSFMYIWQFQLGPDYTIIGRTWEEFDKLLRMLKYLALKCKKKFKLSDTPVFCCYVHNLAYEWQYLQGRYHFKNEDCFFRDVRKPIYCKLNNVLLFRCSYLHSNMSLAKFGESMGATVQKLSGQKFDYSKIRFPWTTLTEEELAYCVNDVRTLEECIRLELERDGDTLLTIPLTSTGYVRRECKEAVKPLYYSLSQQLPDYETYQLLRRCFRGGDTHANRFRVSQIQYDCEGWDMESDYPCRQLNDAFPMGPFRKLTDEDNTMERVIKLAAKGNAVIGDYIFKGIHLRDPKDGFPYIPLSKCNALHPVLDNGRILSADMITIALTEIDLKIIIEQYDFKSIKVHNAMTAVKAPLPEAYRTVLKTLYQKKTGLKGVKGQEYYYGKSKNKFNAVYGMSAQQPLHPAITYDAMDPEDSYHVTIITDPDGADEQLKKAAFPYQWGVYVTAYARKALRDGLAIIGKDENGVSNAVYCDTDSIKCVGHADFTALNAKIRAISQSHGATATDKHGKPHYIGVWDYEGHYQRFLTHGAKRYCYETDDNQLHVVVSGVTKQINEESKLPFAVEELMKAGAEHGTDAMGAFTKGMIWRDAGGTMAVYNDTDDMDYTDPVTGNTIRISPNVSIVPTTYTLTYDKDYDELIENCIQWIKYLNERGGKMK